ncbi:hypothetical protein GCM10009415_05190 [Chitinophaga japonensis]
MVGCDDETKVCDQALTTDTHIRFLRDSAGITRDTTMTQVTLYALTIKDSIYRKQAVSNIFLPLSPVADSSRFYLKVDSISTPDTLTFRYSREPHFISPGCGFSTFFTLDTVISTTNTIRSLIINQRAITSSINDTAHITLYFGI